MIEDYDEIRIDMILYCVSEDYHGDVVQMDGVLQTNCMGFGYQPVSELDLDDIEILQR